ncbi:hypothetical protein INR49_016645 [Caranx melampygus]|nr:hypothetical protein INR49_016645 [Caranx melampygus]
MAWRLNVTPSAMACCCVCVYKGGMFYQRCFGHGLWLGLAWLRYLFSRRADFKKKKKKISIHEHMNLYKIGVGTSAGEAGGAAHPQRKENGGGNEKGKRLNGGTERRNGEDRDRVEAKVLGTLTAGIVNLETPLPTCLHHAKEN